MTTSLRKRSFDKYARLKNHNSSSLQNGDFAKVQPWKRTMALKPLIKRSFPETGVFSGFVRRQVGGQMSQLGKLFNSNVSQMFKKCCKDAKWLKSTKIIQINRNVAFFLCKYISCVSCVMRAITGFITTHLPSVAAPAPLIHNLKRSQTNLQGGLYTYRIHLAPGVIK